MKRVFLLFWIAVWISSASGQAERTLSQEQKIVILARLWQEVNYNFVHFNKVPEVNWDREFETSIPRVLAARTEIEFVRELQRFMAVLNEGHTVAVPARRLREIYGGTPALELDVIEDRPVVVNAGAAIAGTIPIGSVILSVDGIPADVYLKERVFPYVSASTKHSLRYKAINGRGEPAIGLLIRKVGTKINVSFETPDRKTKAAILECLPQNAAVNWLKTPETEQEIFRMRWLDGGIALIELNGFHKKEVLDSFRENLDQLSKARAIIFDIRKNKGGNSGYGNAIGSHFIQKDLVVGLSRARENISTYRALGRYQSHPQYKSYFKGRSFTAKRKRTIEPKKPYFDVPVIVLTGSKTYSAGDDFAALMSLIPGVKLVGTTTAGSTGQPLILTLGDVAFAGITAKHDLLPDGTEFIGRGIVPDIEVEETISAFRQRRDLVIERALRELQATGNFQRSSQLRIEKIAPDHRNRQE